MLTRLEKAKQNWGGAHAAIDNWLDERKTLLVLFCQLTGIQTTTDKPSTPQGLPEVADIKQFCQIMVDYISAGHFEVYEQIINQSNLQQQTGVELLERVFPQITATTQVCLSFDERYADCTLDEDNSVSFDRDLSVLGEALEERFELEDQLIQTMFNTQTSLES